MTVVNQSQFAALQGFSVGYVTKLKQTGRLVLTREGKVDVEASVQRIRDTEDPNRSDVRARHRANRSARSSAAPGATNDKPAPVRDPGQLPYQAARAMKENFLALQAKADYEKSIGELVPAVAVRLAGLNLGAMLRSQLESLPDRLASELAAISEPARIHARLVEQIEDALRQISEGVEKL